jgi:hypothetical protein
MSDDDNVETIVIKTHSKVSKTVSKCLRILNPDTPDSSHKPMKIIADAKVAGKAITITEIVKRRLVEHGKAVKQTTGVQEKPVLKEEVDEDTTKTHLQGEGYEKPKKKVDAQLVIRLERSVEGSV